MSMNHATVARLLLLMMSVAAAPALPAPDSELSGTAWRLLEIASMDDTHYRPADPSGYTLIFGRQGTAFVQADCQRGSGTWHSPMGGQLGFGPITVSQAPCPSASLGDRYFSQFEWVRSYVMREGHLFLATMADGAIIEFEPEPGPVAAVVLGDVIRTTDAEEMQQIILTRLFDRYARQHDLAARPEEIDACIAALQRGMDAQGLTAAESLTPGEAAEWRAMRREMAAAMVRKWKLNQSLHRDYGGRIIHQQLGPEPLDAYRRYLEERQEAGDFTILAPALAAGFWRYFRDESLHEFMEGGSEEAARALERPPWEPGQRQAPAR
jgi:heat shock protein HslJ